MAQEFKKNKPFDKNKPFRKTNSGSRKRTSGTGRSERSSERSTEKPFGNNPFRKPKGESESEEGRERPQEKKERPQENRERPRRFDKKSFNPNKDLKREGESYFERKRKNLADEERKSERPSERKFERTADRKPFEKESGEKKFFKKTFPKRNVKSSGYRKLSDKVEPIGDGLIRLNKYISNAGICSRREADELISAGTVKVNGVIVTEMGYKVKPDDHINYGGETLRKEKLVYVLLNKPKDFITTLEDPGNRKTVFDLVRKACKERIYPVGRLDRNTTGVLLLTNDGDLTKKLTHPKHGIKKIYQVTLDKPLGKPDLDEIAKNGVTLEDGHIQPDVISYSGDGSNKKEVGLEIHSGRNRIVRRLFEHLGYEVIKLDRVVFAGLTKKDLPRGNWRILSEQEVGFLKMLG